MSVFEHRGVVEGFYGPPFSQEDRLWLVERMGSWGLNRYLYAPKDDPLHRSSWREPYDAQACAHFARLVEVGAQAGVEVGFAVSPGLSMGYASAEDRSALISKYRAFVELGARFLSLALDDVPDTLAHAQDRERFASLGHAQASVANELQDALGPEITLWLVPTDYLGVEPSRYLEVLGAELLDEVEVGWTGPTTISPKITSVDAQARAKALGRKLLLWDNVPVSDGPMRHMLHLGPYTGREAGLDQHLSGVLLNPMEHAHASAIALRTAAFWLEAPQRYDPERAWAEALDELGAGDPEALRTFALAQRFSPLWPDDRDSELEASFAALVECLEAGLDLVPALDELRARVALRLAAAPRVRERLADRALVGEIEPWLAAHERETRRLDAALSCARAVLGEGSRAERMRALMALESRLLREPPQDHASYGPRRVLYPQLRSTLEASIAFSDDPALIRDRNLIDELIVFFEDLALWLLSAAD